MTTGGATGGNREASLIEVDVVREHTRWQRQQYEQEAARADKAEAEVKRLRAVANAARAADPDHRATCCDAGRDPAAVCNCGLADLYDALDALDAEEST